MTPLAPPAPDIEEPPPQQGEDLIARGKRLARERATETVLQRGARLAAAKKAGVAQPPVVPAGPDPSDGVVGGTSAPVMAPAPVVAPPTVAAAAPTRPVMGQFGKRPIAEAVAAATPKPVDTSPPGPYAAQTEQMFRDITPEPVPKPKLPSTDEARRAMFGPDLSEQLGAVSQDTSRSKLTRGAAAAGAFVTGAVQHPVKTYDAMVTAIPAAVNVLLQASHHAAAQAELVNMGVDPNTATPGPTNKETIVAAAQLAAMGIAGPLENMVGKAMATQLTARAAAKGTAAVVGLDRAAAIAARAIGTAPIGAAFNPDDPIVGAIAGSLLGGAHATATGARATVGESPLSLNKIADLFRTKEPDEPVAPSGPPPQTPTGGVPIDALPGGGGGGGGASGPPRTLPTGAKATRTLELDVAPESPIAAAHKSLLERIVDRDQPAPAATPAAQAAPVETPQTGYQAPTAVVHKPRAADVVQPELDRAKAALAQAEAAWNPIREQGLDSTPVGRQAQGALTQATRDVERLENELARSEKPKLRQPPAPVADKPASVNQAPEPPATTEPHEYIPKASGRALTEEQMEVRNVADGLRIGHPDAIDRAAPEMATRVPKGAILVPLPDHTGNTFANERLAEAIMEHVHADIAPVLARNAAVPNSQELRDKGKPGVTAAEHAATLTTTGSIPPGRPVVFIDAVETTGAQAEAARRALDQPDATLVTYAKAPIPAGESKAGPETIIERGERVGRAKTEFEQKIATVSLDELNAMADELAERPVVSDRHKRELQAIENEITARRGARLGPLAPLHHTEEEGKRVLAEAEAEDNATFLKKEDLQRAAAEVERLREAYKRVPGVGSQSKLDRAEDTMIEAATALGDRGSTRETSAQRADRILASLKEWGHGPMRDNPFGKEATKPEPEPQPEPEEAKKPALKLHKPEPTPSAAAEPSQPSQPTVEESDEGSRERVKRELAEEDRDVGFRSGPTVRRLASEAREELNDPDAGDADFLREFLPDIDKVRDQVEAAANERGTTKSPAVERALRRIDETRRRFTDAIAVAEGKDEEATPEKSEPIVAPPAPPSTPPRLTKPGAGGKRVVPESQNERSMAATTLEEARHYLQTHEDMLDAGLSTDEETRLAKRTVAILKQRIADLEGTAKAKQHDKTRLVPTRGPTGDVEYTTQPVAEGEKPLKSNAQYQRLRETAERERDKADAARDAGANAAEAKAIKEYRLALEAIGDLFGAEERDKLHTELGTDIRLQGGRGAYRRDKPTDKDVIYFHSGANRPSEIRAFTDLGKSVGVSASKLDEAGMTELETLGAKPDVHVFLDSGAFSEFTGRSPEISDATWRQRLEQADQLSRTLGMQLHVVAPDRVGDQAATLQRLATYREPVQQIATRSHVLVTMQLGDTPPEEFYRQAQKALGLESFTPALPMNKAAMTNDQAVAFVAAVKPESVHLLGIGPLNKRFDDVIRRIKEAHPGIQVTADSAALRRVSGKDNGPGGGPRALTQHQQNIEAEGYDTFTGETAGEFGEHADYTEDQHEPSGWASEAELKQIADDAGLEPDVRKRFLAEPDAVLQEDWHGTSRWEDPRMAEALDAAWRRHLDRTMSPSQRADAVRRTFGTTPPVAPDVPTSDTSTHVETPPAEPPRLRKPGTAGTTGAPVASAAGAAGAEADRSGTVGPDVAGSTPVGRPGDVPDAGGVGDAAPASAGSEQPGGGGVRRRPRVAEASEPAEAGHPVRDEGAAPDRAGEPSEGDRGGEPAPGQRDAPSSDDGGVHGPDAKVRGTDFRITDDDVMIVGGDAKKARANIEAIKLVAALDEAGRPATREEQAILAQYVGWGGLKAAFDLRLKDPFFADINRQLRELLSDEEYADANRSATNAHYTSRLVVNEMWRAVQRMGFNGGRVLEAGVGVGNFIGLIPDILKARTHFTGVERDRITASIAKYLYPQQHIIRSPYEAVPLDNDWYDMAIGNPPFGDVPVFDKSYPKALTQRIHDYFFIKDLDKVRPGGILALVTSDGTMDKASSTARRAMAERGDFLGAIRLPNTAFKTNAGTGVTTDIIFFRKRLPGVPPAGEPWLDVVSAQTPKGTFKINEYYAKHPEQMLGEMEKGGQYSADDQKLVPREGEDLGAALAAAVNRLPENVYVPRPRDSRSPGARESLPATGEALTVRDGALAVVDGKLMQRVGNEMIPAPVPETRRVRVTALVRIRDAANLVRRINTEHGADELLASAQKHLNTLYDAFVATYGPINTEKRTESEPDEDGETIVRVTFPNLLSFSMDPDSPIVAALENYDYEEHHANPKTYRAAKADTMLRRTVAPRQVRETAETPNDALLISLNDQGRVDLDYMGRLLGKSIGDVRAALVGQIFKDPTTGAWDTLEGYTSGDVKKKLAIAQAAAKSNPAFAENVTALTAAIPADLPPGKIGVELGAPWVPPSDIEAFIRDLFELPRSKLKVSYNAHDSSWIVDGYDKRARDSVQATRDYGTHRMHGLKLVAAALNRTHPIVYDKNPDGSRSKNVEQTLVAEEKAEKIKARFRRWLWEDDSRARRLVRVYNDRYNTIRLRHHSGEHLTMPGVATHVGGVPFAFQPHQKDFIARFLYDGRAAAFHVVGAGKTFASIGALMEAKRLGFVQKGILSVPNHMLGQWSREFLQLYPGANLLVATEKDFDAKNRKAFTARIAANNYDAIIMTHSAMELIPVSKAAQEAYINEELEELVELIVSANAGSDKSLVRELENAKARLEVKLEELHAEEKKDDLLDWEELGIDCIVVDEAHMFKNLRFNTRLKGVAGRPSQRAMDLELKLRHVHKVNPKHSAMLLTGTPVSNSISEVYVMQRYMQPELLAERGLQKFDAWANTFAAEVLAMEMSPSGDGFVNKSRFSKFVNLGELAQMFRTFGDVQMAHPDPLKPNEKAEDFPVEPNLIRLERPPIVGGGKDGQPEQVVAPSSHEMQLFMAWLIERARNIRGQRPEPGADNFLAITGDGRLAALDLRLVDKHAVDRPDNKLSMAANRIAKIYKDTTEIKGTQLVFSDILRSGKRGVPGFDVYQDLVSKLVARGVDKDEIAIIHDYDTTAKRLDLFARVRSGKIRVLIGSTEKMGAGMNVQKRLVALHHLDVRWRPSDIEQREGRILRQGNLLYRTGKIPGVQILRYVSEGSLDAFMWGTVARKAVFIFQMLTANAQTREIEDVDEQAMSYAEIAAAASGDPRIMERATLDALVQKYERLERAYDEEQYKTKAELANDIPSRLAQTKDLLSALEKDAKRAVDTRDTKFTIVIDGTTYTKRADAAKALAAIIPGVTTNQASRNLGTFAGFPLSLFRAFARTYFVMDGALRHETEAVGPEEALSGPLVETGLIARLEALPRGIPARIAHAQEAVDQIEKRRAGLQARVGLPFEQEKALGAASDRLRELNVALSAEEQKKAGAGNPITAKPGFSPQELNERFGTPGSSGGNDAVHVLGASNSVFADDTPEEAAARAMTGLGALTARPRVYTGNFATESDRWLTNGQMMIDTRAVSSTSAKTQAALEKLRKPTTDRTRSQLPDARAEETFNRIVADATSPAEFLGVAAEPRGDTTHVAYVRGDNGVVVRLNAHLMKMAVAATGADTVRVGPTSSSAVVLLAAGKPVAVIMGMKGEGSIDVELARKIAAVRPGGPTQLMGFADPFTAAAYMLWNTKPVQATIGRAAAQLHRGRMEMRSIFNAAAMSPDAGAMSRMIRHHRAEMDRDIEKMEQAIKEVRADIQALDPGPMFDGPRWDWYTELDELGASSIENPITRRRPTLRRPLAQETRGTTAQLQHAADVLRELQDDVRDQIQALGPGHLDNFLANYWARVYVDLDAAKKKAAMGAFGGKRPFAGPKGFKRGRRHVDFTGSLAAALAIGKGPPTDNPLDMVALKIREMKRYLMAHRIFNEGRDLGIIKFSRRGIPEGYAAINDDIAVVRAPRGLEGEERIRGRYVAPIDVARVLNNFLSPGLRGKSWTYDAYSFLGNTINMVQLGLSAFHAGFVAFDATVQTAAVGLDQMLTGATQTTTTATKVGAATVTTKRWTPDPRLMAKGAAKIALSAASAASGPFTVLPLPAAVMSYLLGRKTWHAYFNDATSKEMEEVINALVMGGGRAKMDDFYHNRSVDKLRAALRDKRWGKAGLTLPFAVIEGSMYPLLEHVVPRMKLGAIYMMMQAELAKLPKTATLDEVRDVAARVVDAIDARLGQMIYDNRFWHRVTKELLMVGIRSVGWQTGGLDVTVGAGAQLAENVGGLMRGSGGGGAGAGGGSGSGGATPPGGTPPTPRQWHKVQYLATLAGIVALYGAIYTYLHTGDSPGDVDDLFQGRDFLIKDLYFPRTGGKNKDGNWERMQPATYMKDVFALARHPINTISHKIHPLIAYVGDVLANRDFMNNMIHDEDPGFWRHRGQDYNYLVHDVLQPFSVRNLQEMQKRGEGMREKVEGFFGTQPAPTDVVRSDAQSLMNDFLARRGHPSRSPDQVDASNARRAVEEGVRNKTVGRDSLRKLTRAGVLSVNQATSIATRAAQAPPLVRFKLLTPEEQARVYELATPDEKASWAKEFAAKQKKRARLRRTSAADSAMTPPIASAVRREKTSDLASAAAADFEEPLDGSTETRRWLGGSGMQSTLLDLRLPEGEDPVIERAKKELAENGITQKQRKLGYLPRASEALYRNVIPYNYTGHGQEITNAIRDFVTPGRPIADAIKGGEGAKGSDEHIGPGRKDAWRLYLGLPQQHGTFGVSDYRPSKGGDESTAYMKLNQWVEGIASSPSELERAPDDWRTHESSWESVKTPRDVVKFLVETLEKNPSHKAIMHDNNAGVMGDYTVGRGKDDRGSYVSYYDKWDLATAGTLSPVGNPYEIYDRVYYDPKTYEPLSK